MVRCCGERDHGLESCGSRLATMHSYTTIFMLWHATTCVTAVFATLKQYQYVLIIFTYILLIKAAA
ncbi:hypothetical protein BDY19DRAFT_922911, partial [Irpex rosettiformis]